MTVLTTKARDALSKKQFALPKQEKYPIPDVAHGRSALSYVSQHGTPAQRQTVRSKVYNKFPQLKKNFQKREGESPTSKENLMRQKLSAYEQGYIDTLRKLAAIPEEYIPIPLEERQAAFDWIDRMYADRAAGRETTEPMPDVMSSERSPYTDWWDLHSNYKRRSAGGV